MYSQCLLACHNDLKREKMLFNVPVGEGGQVVETIIRLSQAIWAITLLMTLTVKET